MRKPNAMIRSNVFLSKAEKLELARIGRQKKISAAEVLRQILDHALGTAPKQPEINLSVLDLTGRKAASQK